MLIVEPPIVAETPWRPDHEMVPLQEQSCVACATNSAGLCEEHGVLVVELL